jgi:Mg-chelatase subunit ChlD
MDTQDARGDDGDSRAVRSAGLVLLLVALLLIGLAFSWLLWAPSDDAPASRVTCSRYRTVELAVAPAMFGVVSRAVEEVAPPCTRVEPSLRTGSEVALATSTGQPLPDVWIPDARFWLSPTFLGRAGVRMVSPSLARTPVLLVGGSEARRFGSWGEAEVSGLVSVPDPSTSTAGALAVVAPQVEARAVGRSPDASRQMVVPFAQQYGERRSRGLDADVAPTALESSSPRLVVATEQELVQARGDAPYLRDLTPSVGAPMLDFPLVVRRGASSGANVVARGLVRYLSDGTGTTLLHEAGLREPDAAATDDTLGAPVPAYLPPAPPRAVATTVQSWRTLSVPSAILAVVDASGSMDFAATGGTRMELLADAAGIGLSFLPDHARVGLWIFSIDKGGPGQDWRVLEPMRRLDTLAFGRTQRYALREWSRQLPALTGGGTGLYDTALAAYKQAQRDYRPGFSNAVVLMTDGENEDPGSIGLDQLVSRLQALRDPQRPVRIVGIAISSDADLGALQQMAAATNGRAYLAAEPTDILGVFAQAVLSR